MKVVLAYSGGLDTSVIIRWLIEKYDAEVIAFAADVGGFGTGSDSAWNIHLLLGYRLQLFGREAIIRGGYRALHQEYKTGSGRSTFKWDVTQEGPIAGIALKF